MKTEDFERLKESMIEAGEIMRGQRAPARGSVHETQEQPPVTSLAICLKTDDPELLIPRRIYEVTQFNNGLVRVIDEAGEAAIYPASFFVAISLPQAIETALAKIA